MDEALKARLIGAAVLVALAVLLIPEILSGGKPDGAGDAAATAPPGARTFTIELAGATPDTAPATKPPPASPPAVAPAQSAGEKPDSAKGSAPAASADSKPAVQATARDAGNPAPPTPARPGPAATAPESTSGARSAAAVGAGSGGWAVQVGAFSTAATANRLAGQLKAAGFRAYVSPVSRSGKTLQRVRVGPEAERARADSLAASLKARGLPATVVASD
jgi:DedD protein